MKPFWLTVHVKIFCFSRQVLHTCFVRFTAERLLAISNMATVLKGIACLVAGGANGLGRATAQKLVEQGCRVVIADLPSSEGDKVAGDLGEKCVFVPTDVRRNSALVFQNGAG